MRNSGGYKSYPDMSLIYHIGNFAVYSEPDFRYLAVKSAALTTSRQQISKRLFLYGGMHCTVDISFSLPNLNLGNSRSNVISTKRLSG